MKRNILNVTF